MRRHLLSLLVGASLGAAAVAAAPTVAAARAEKTVTYDRARVFTTAVRFLRVDVGATITERDADAGYILFELIDEGKAYPGALELIEVDTGGDRPAVRLALRLDDRPAWMEVDLLDKLERKLRAELGKPPRIERKPKDPPPPPADGNGDGEAGASPAP